MFPVYARYGTAQYDEDIFTLDQAKSYLRGLEDEGEGYALGIYDEDTKTMHIPQNMDIAGQPEGAVLLQKQTEFRKLGLEINTIVFYDKSI